MNDDDLRKLLDAARKRGRALAKELAPCDLGLIRGSDVAFTDFNELHGDIPKMRPADVRSYCDEDVKTLFGDSLIIDAADRHQYFRALLDGVRFP